MFIVFALWLLKNNKLTIGSLFFFFLLKFLMLNNSFLDYSFENWIYTLLQTFINAKIGFGVPLVLYVIAANYFGRLLFFNITIFYFMFSLFGNVSSLNFMSTFNAGLFNGLLLVHPMLLFLSYVFIFLVSFEYFNKFFESKHFSSLNTFLMQYTMFFIVISIILGAIWAQQELNWGGWWGWDLVEVGSLVWLTAFIFFIHFRFLTFNFYYLRNFLLCSLFFFYIGLRLALFDSVHSFVGDSTINLRNYSYLYILPLVSLMVNFVRLESSYLYKLFKIIIYFLVFIIIQDFIHKYFIIFYSFLTVRLLLCALIFFFIIFLFTSLSYNFIGFFLFFFNFFNFFNFFVWRGHTFHFLLLIFLYCSLLLKFDFFQTVFDFNALQYGITLSKHIILLFSQQTFYDFTLAPINFFLYQKYFLYIGTTMYFTLETELAQTDIWVNNLVCLHGLILSINHALNYYFLVPSLFCLFICFLIRK